MKNGYISLEGSESEKDIRIFKENHFCIVNKYLFKNNRASFICKANSKQEYTDSLNDVAYYYSKVKAHASLRRKAMTIKDKLNKLYESDTAFRNDDKKVSSLSSKEFGIKYNDDFILDFMNSHDVLEVEMKLKVDINFRVEH